MTDYVKPNRDRALALLSQREPVGTHDFCFILNMVSKTPHDLASLLDVAVIKICGWKSSLALTRRDWIRIRGPIRKILQAPTYEQRLERISK